MARNKQNQRKVKVKSEELHSQSEIKQESDALECNVLASEGQNAAGFDDDCSCSESSSQGPSTKEIADNLTKVKKEGAMVPRTSSPASESSKKRPVVSVQHVKVKKEPLSSSVASSALLDSSATGAAMDLGSHLQQSLSTSSSSVLTWSQLMEPSNLPRMPSVNRAAVKKEQEPTEEHLPIVSTQSDSAGDPGNPSEERTTEGGNVNMINLFSFPKTNKTSPVTSTPSISLSRFTSHLENTGKARASEGGAAGNILDLSQRSLPPGIRRVLASKYGKKVEEGHTAAMQPNFRKSRSRFIVAPRKAPGSERIPPSEKKEEPESPPPSMVIWREDQSDGGYPSLSSMASSQVATETRKAVPKIKLSELAVSELRAPSVVVENRDSSVSPSSHYLALGDQPTKDASDHLKNQGLLDLGSHYGDLLRESSPKLTSRSSSRSPRVDESAGGSPAPPGEALIELARSGGPMIYLSSVETPPPPHSPSFRTMTFQSQNYRPSYLPGHLPGQTYKPGRIASRPIRRNSSPGPRPSLGLVPPSDRSSSPQARMLSGVRGTFGKSSDFVSNRDFEGPLRVASGVENRAPKRPHSVCSEEGVKKPCTEGNNQSRSEVSKGESGVKVNIGNLLKLEQEEQKYIQDLSVVQADLTGVRLKMHKLQQELRLLQCSETDIKRRIEVVRSRRLGILKDAQDREGSGGTRETNTRGISNNSEERTRAVVVERQAGVFSDRRVTYDRASPGFSSGTRGKLSDGYSGSVETKRKVELVDGVKEEEQVTRRESERSKTRGVEVSGDLSDSNQVLCRLSRNPHSVPSDLVLLSSHSYNDTSVALQSQGTQHNRQYPIMSSRIADGSDLARENLGKFEGLDSDESKKAFRENIPGYVDKYEILDDCADAEKQDGMVLVRQGSHGRHSRKGLSSVIHKQTELDQVVKVSGEDVYSSDGGSRQFLGCLEISSTTEEPLTDDDEGRKEILAEKERESLANKMSCEQERISSTVLSLDDVKQAGTSDSLSEMEFLGHTSAVCFVLPCKGKLFSASADRTAKAFDLNTGECMTTFQGHQEAVNCLQIASEDGNKDRLFTGSNDQTVRAYNAKSGMCTHKFSFRGRVMCLHIAFGKLFVGLSSGFVAVIDLKTNKCIDQFNCHEQSRISCLSSASEGQRSLLCTGSFDSTITIRDQCTGLLLRTITDHKLTVLCMQVVENILFSGSADAIVQSHNINTGQLVRSYTGHFMSVSGLQALGGVLVTSSLDRIIRCFDIKSGDLLQLYGGNSDMIFSLAVFSDMIYTGCRDGRLSGIKLDLRKYHCCKWSKCSLKFGLLSHLKQHVQDHVNQTIAFDGCLWEDCVHKFPRGKQLDVIQAAMEHIIKHVSES